MGKIALKLFDGKPPKKNSFMEIGETDFIYGVKWRTFIEINEGASKWKKMKICASGKVHNKANYWTSWNGERLSGGHDMRLMEEHRPEIKTLF